MTFFCVATMGINQRFFQKFFLAFFSSLQRCMVFHGRRQAIISALWCIVLLASCGRDKEEIVQAKVAERVQAFRIKQITECRTNLLRDAEKRVDSMLLAEAKGTLADSLSRLKPFKPSQPPPVLPIDSLSVRPIFEQPSGN